YDPLREEIYRALGLETIAPTVIGAEMIHQFLMAGGKEKR
ncbi:MAG: TrkA family potassium uptake protein, partial [Chloroflexi bacterium]|nr:TrkA family potassium uptake protein [Chloroflexota bacterium]